MEILCLSLNHTVTALEIREAVAFDRPGGEAFLDRVHALVDPCEALLVSTCNRTEVYLAHHEPEADLDRALLQLLREERSFEAVEHPRNYAVARDEEAVRHLFRVAAGLESQILGESQILSQVKEAHGWARSAGTLGRVLHRLWERALRVGKRVRTETAIGEGALSASYAALELARKIFGRLRGKRVLVIGAGEIGMLAIENLQGIDLDELAVMNRTRSRADAIAERFGCIAVDFEALPDALARADLVISSTSAPGPIVDYETMRSVRQRRGGNRPLLVVDLALPRDFEDRCGQLDEVFLKNLDDLHDIVSGNIAGRERELPRADSIVETELETFFEWLGSLEVEPTIRRLRERFHEVRRLELEALSESVDPDTLERVDRITRRLVNRILHVPQKNLRRHPGARDPEFIGTLNKLLIEEIPHRNSADEEGAGRA